jgi:hypothetical protein
MRRVRIAWALLWVPLAAGCATFADPPQPAIVRGPQLAPRPSASLEVSVDAFLGSGMPSLVEKSLSDSGLFSSVSQGREQQDLRVSISIVRTQTPMSGGLLSLLTGLLVPATDQRSLSVAATIHDPHSGIDTYARHHHGFRTWMQLFLLPLWFTHSPAAYERDLLAQLSRSAVSEALTDWSQSPARGSP